MILPWRNVEVIPGGPLVPTSLTTEEIDRLCDLADFGRVLEIGTAYGYSAIRMAEVARRVVTVDPHAGENPDSLAQLRQNLAECDVLNVTVVVGESLQLFGALADLGATFDLVFVDGSHDATAVAADVFGAQRVLRRGGTLACHDYGEESCPGVKETLDRIQWAPLEIVDTLWVR